MESSSIGFVFDSIVPITVPVSIAGAEYELREAGAGVAAKYRNHSMRAAKFSDGKMSGIDGAASSEPYLLSLCLFEGGGNPVQLNTVLAWPERVVKPLVAWIKDHSAMGEQTLAQLEAELEVVQRKVTEMKVKGSPGKNSPEPAEATTA